MGRVINIDELWKELEILYDAKNGEVTWNDALWKIKRAPVVESNAQQWIPCSERLPDNPENDDYYLVTIQCEHYDGWDDYVTGFAEWTKHGWEELSCYIGQIKVVAWMPLPESYKGE